MIDAGPSSQVTEKCPDEAGAAHKTSRKTITLTYPVPGGPFKGHSPHALDLPCTFDHVTQPQWGPVFGLSENDQPLADQMHHGMVSFVGQGRPSAPGLPEWLRYNAETRATMILDNTPALVADPHRTERLIWEE